MANPIGSSTTSRTAVAIDGRDFPGKVSGALTQADIKLTEISNLEDLVTKLEAQVAKQGPLSQLRLYDHGSAGRMQVGDDNIFKMDFSANPDVADPDVVARLKRLGALMAPGGVIELHNCEIADTSDGRDFVERLSEVTGATVRAAVNVQSAIIPAYQGDVFECAPGSPGARPSCRSISGGWLGAVSDAFDAAHGLK